MRLGRRGRNRYQRRAFECRVRCVDHLDLKISEHAEARAFESPSAVGAGVINDQTLKVPERGERESDNFEADHTTTDNSKSARLDMVVGAENFCSEGSACGRPPRTDD